MIDPWSFVDADDDEVADFLAATVQSVIELGGWLNPHTRLVCRAGDIHLECTANDDEPLVRIPREAMLPVDRVAWADDTTSLALTDIGSWPDEADISLMFTQIGLHNACGKIPQLCLTHPAASTELTPNVIRALQAVRPSFRTRNMAPAEVFWSTRTFKIAAFDDVAEPLALPIVDLANHHAEGATGQWRDGSFIVPVRHAGDSAECFLDYGMNRDALDLALVYGFVAEPPSIAHSAPVALDGNPGIEVLGQGRTLTGDLQGVSAESGDDRWAINRFTFGEPDATEMLSAATGESAQSCARMISELAQANLDLLDTLDATLVTLPDVPVREVLESASAQVRAVLKEHAHPST